MTKTTAFRQVAWLFAAAAAVATGVVLALGAFGAGGAAGSVQPRWVITDLGTLGGKKSEATAINDRGQIVGWSDTKLKDKDGYPVGHVFLWQDGRMRVLRPDLSPFAINGRGQVIGSVDAKAEDGFFYSHAALWQNGKVNDLGTLPGGWESRAVAINERGQVVGWGPTKSSPHAAPWEHAVLWENGKMRDLGTLPGGWESRAVAINERGQIVGRAEGRSTATRPCGTRAS